MRFVSDLKYSNNLSDSNISLLEGITMLNIVFFLKFLYTKDIKLCMNLMIRFFL